MISDTTILSGVENHKYRVEIAQSPSQIEEALKLRYKVFYNELNRNFQFKGKKDQDRYDEQSHHLLVIEKESEKIIGTYRLQTYAQAMAGYGFVSNKRFILEDLPESVQKKSFEVGRVCIDPNHRGGRVLYLLWKGLAGYLLHYDLRYLFGYAALDNQDPKSAIQVYQYLMQNNFLNSEYKIRVKNEFKLHFENGSVESEKIIIPPLLQNYLDVGTKICSEPAYDSDLNLNYFFILLDVESISDRTRKMFFG